MQVSDRKDIIAQSIHYYTKHTITASNYFVTDTSSDPMYQLANDYEPSGEKHLFTIMGTHVGTWNIVRQNTLKCIKKISKRYLNVGSYPKMHASKMSEQLMLKCPGEFSLPGEIEIKRYISKLAQERERGTKKATLREDKNDQT